MTRHAWNLHHAQQSWLTYIIGAITRNIIEFIVKSKTCSKCKTANRLGIDVEDHECQINWDGSSGAMEAGVALKLCIDLNDYKYEIYLEFIVSEDDSSMRSHLRYESDGDTLSAHIPPPRFLTDPSHQIKVMAKPIDEMTKKSRAPVEHSFNCHEWCNPGWCWAKELENKNMN